MSSRCQKVYFLIVGVFLTAYATPPSSLLSFVVLVLHVVWILCFNMCLLVFRWSETESEKAEMAVGLLLLMEFSAKAKLKVLISLISLLHSTRTQVVKEPGLSHLIQQAVTLSLPASKFEIIADLCCQPDSKNHQGKLPLSPLPPFFPLLFHLVALEALKISLRLYMQPTIKYDKCGIYFV
jgi:hypothetical protein